MDQRVARAEAAARASNLSRARKILTSPGLAPHDAIDEMRVKHPFHAPPSIAFHDPSLWEPPLPPDHPTDPTTFLTPKALADALRKSPRGGAADQLGWRAHEDIAPLFADIESAVAQTFCDRVAFCFFSGHFTPDTLNVPSLGLLNQNDAHSNSAPAGVLGIQGSQKLGQSSPRQNRSLTPKSQASNTRLAQSCIDTNTNRNLLSYRGTSLVRNRPP